MAFFVAILSYANSCEQDDPDLKDTLKQIKSQLLVRKTKRFPEGRDLPKDEDFTQIERALFVHSSGYKLPETLVSFYKEVGNRDFPGVTVYTPEGGKNSNLYTIIREGQEKNIPNIWIAFAKFAGHEYFCINHKTGEVCLYIVFPEIYMDEVTYPNLSSWIKKKWLSR